MTKIKNGNEFIEVHENENGTFLVFGAEENKKRFAYEMNLSQSDKIKLAGALAGGLMGIYGHNDKTLNDVKGKL